MTVERARKLIDEAIKTNLKRDRIDRSNGFATPSDINRDEVIHVSIAALHCGLVLDDWSAVAEAVVMLSEMSGFKPWEYTS